MTRQKRSRIIISVLIAAALTVGIYCYIMSRDIAPPDVSDLELEYLDIPHDQNAFTYIDQAGILWEPIRRGMTVPNIVTPIYKYDPVEMEKLMTSSRIVFEKLDRGLEYEHLQFPRITSFDADLPYLSSFVDLARMQLNRSLHLFKQGREKEAFDVLIDTVRFGSMMERGKGCFNNFLAGMNAKHMALQRLRELLPETTLGTETLRPYIEKLEPYYEDGESLEHAIKLEFHIWSAVIDELRDGKRPYSDVLTVPPRKMLRMPYSFKPNETRKMLADDCRRSMANLKRPSNEFEYSKFAPAYCNIAGVSIYRGRNWVGRHLCYVVMPACERCVIKIRRSNVSIVGTQLLIALRCYKIDNNDLPETLEEIVPEYIDKLPDINYDGKPLRYSKEKKIIYSVGDDMRHLVGPTIEEIEEQDNRRSLRPFLWDEGKPAFKIDF